MNNVVAKDEANILIRFKKEQFVNTNFKRLLFMTCIKEASLSTLFFYCLFLKE
jgi:hypothetical protein